jgi:hypothetical protein
MNLFWAPQYLFKDIITLKLFYERILSLVLLLLTDTSNSKAFDQELCIRTILYFTILYYTIAYTNCKSKNSQYFSAVDRATELELAIHITDERRTIIYILSWPLGRVIETEVASWCDVK